MDEYSTEGLLVLISRKIPDSRLEQLKVVAYGLGVSKVDLRERSVFNDVIACITNKLGQEKEAITFAYNVLKLLDYHVEEHIISEPEYGDVRLKYPEIDLRLTVTNLVKDLEEEDYEILLSYVCSKSGVNTDRIESRWDLVNLMFDELMESPDDITLVCEVCDVFNHKPLILDYCSRQEKEKPDFVFDAHQMSQDQQESFREFYCRQKQKKQELETEKEQGIAQKPISNPKECTRKRIACFTVLGLTLLAVVLAGTATTVGLAFNSDSNQKSTYINLYDSSVVNIKPDGFKDNSNHIELTIVSNENITLNVYKERCGDLPMLIYSLPSHHSPQLNSTLNFKRQPYNYRGQDNPIYGLEGSFLVFNLSATGSNNTDPGCLRIQIFNNYNYYFDATNPGEDNTTQVDGVVDHSPCLPVGSSGSPANSSWRYTFDRPQYVYATVDEGKMVQIDGSISGYLWSYSLGSLSPVCQLTTQSRTSRTCKANLCDDACIEEGSPTQCIFVQIQLTDSPNIEQTEVTYTMISPSKSNKGFSASLGSFLFVSLVIVVLIVLTICKFYISFVIQKKTYHPI